MRSRTVIDLRRGVPRGQPPLFSPRAPHEKHLRPLPLRARRRRARALIALGILVAVGLFAWGVSFVSYLPRFSIGAVVVEGASAVPQDHVRAYVETILDDGRFHWISRSNIFFYPRADLEKLMRERFPRLESVQLARPSLFSTTLTIRVEERTMYGMWCTEDLQCYEMDETGFIFSETPYATSTPYHFSGGIATSTDPVGQSFVKAQLPGLLSLLRLLGQAGHEPRGTSVVGDQDFLIPLASGFTVKASFGSDANALARNLELVLSSDVLKEKRDRIEYIDLRFGNRVYYKLDGEAEATTGQ